MVTAPKCYRLGAGPVRWLVLAAMVLGVAGLARLGILLSQRARANDFSHYYLASELLLGGANPYPVDLAPLYARHGFVVAPELPQVHAPNPPLFLWWFAPLTLLPPGTAFVVWVAVEFLCLAIILGWTRRLLAGRLSAVAWWGVVGATLASDVVLFHFGFSQMGLLLAALVLTGYGCQRLGWPAAACLVVTVAGLLKLYPFILVPWFVWRGGGGWQGRAGRAGLVAGTIAVVVVATAPELWQGFFEHALPLLTSVSLKTLKNCTLPALVINLGYSFQGFHPAEATTVWWRLAGAGVGFVMIAAAYVACWRAGGRDPEGEFCLLSVVMLAGQLTCWSHYLVFLIFPLAAAVARFPAARSLGRVVLLVVAYILLNSFTPLVGPWLDRHVMLKLLVNAGPVYGLLLMMVWFGREVGAGRTLAREAMGPEAR